MSAKRTTKHTRSKSDQGRVDLKRARKTTDAEIEAQARADGDVEWTPVLLAKAKRLTPRKQAVSIRLDRDILDFFKNEGEGYQSRINAILRTYVSARRAG